jgi:uncharacterized repeat protein (TIGR02543 family)
MASNLVIAAPTRTGYDFTGWTVSGGYNKDGISLTNATPSMSVTITKGSYGAITLTPTWTLASFLLTYDLNASSIVSTPDINGGMATESVLYTTVINTTLGYIKNDVGGTNPPKAAGYTFDGWYLEDTGSTPVGAATMPADAKTIYAKWIVENYTITYTLGDLSVTNAAGNPTGYTVEDAALPITIEDPARTGYDFVGWTATGGLIIAPAAKSPIITSATTGNIIFEAHWTANTYTLNFAANGGVIGTTPSKTVTYDAAVGTLPGIGTGAPTRTGYTFSGWAEISTAAAADFDDTYVVNFIVPKTVYAVWTANTYTVSFNANGGVAGNVTSKTVTYDAAVGAVPGGTDAPARTGYTFLGWSTDNGTSNSVNFDASTVVNFAADKTVYAVWEANTGIALNFDPNGGVAGTTQTKPVTYDAAVGTLPATGSGAPTRDNYTFAGWSTAGGTSNTADFTPAYVVDFTTGKTVYAVWSENTKYAVSYDGNGNTGGTVPTDNGTYYAGGTAFILGTGDLAKSDYTFKEWNTAAAGTGNAYAPGTPVIITGNVTLYAQWTYNGGGGGGGGTTPPDPPKPPVVIPPVVVTPDPPATPIIPPDPTTTVTTEYTGGPAAVVAEPAEPEAALTASSAFTAITGFSAGDQVKLEAQTGNVFRDISNGNVPGGSFLSTGTWSLLDLLLAIIAAVIAIFLIIGMLAKKRREQNIDTFTEKEVRKYKGTVLGAIAVIAGIITVVVFLVSENLNTPAAWVNQWTLPVVIVFAVHIAFFAAYNIRVRKPIAD